MKILKVNYDKLGIITSIACAIHCAVLPVFVAALPFLGVNIIENKPIEWALIILTFCFGFLSFYHGYIHHHHKIIPVILFVAGFSCLILNQIIAERFTYIFIPAAAVSIISAHVLNIYHCRISRKCKVHHPTTGNGNVT